MSSLKLISHKLCPYVQRARIVLNEKGIDHEIEFIDLANKPDWFLALSPLGKVPVLLVDGEPLFESSVIAEYLDEVTGSGLHPADSFEKARHRSWIEFASSTLNAIAGLYSARDLERFEHFRAQLIAKFETLERHLAKGPYFAGQQFSLVDAAAAPVFRYFEVFEQIGDFRFFGHTPKVLAWRRALAARPSVAAAVVPDYHDRLRAFLAQRGSVLAEKLRADWAA